jgi:hypothetical protein
MCVSPVNGTLEVDPYGRQLYRLGHKNVKERISVYYLRRVRGDPTRYETKDQRALGYGETEGISKAPVVMLTSSREEKDLLRSYNLGTNAYVVKPMSFTEFFKAVKEVGLFWGVINQSPGIVEWKP